MASIRERRRKDGSTYYSVLWRAEGRQTSISLDDRRDAEHIKTYLDLSGGVLPPTLTRPHDAPTVAGLVQRHIEALSGVEPFTIHTYRSMLRDHIAPGLGPLRAADVSREVVARWVNALAERRSPKTVRNVHSLLSAAYAFGIAADIVPANPCKGVRMPTRRTVRPGVLISREDFRAILPHLDERYRIVALLLAGTGLRLGEAAALRVGDVDPVASTVTVTGAVKRDGRNGVYVGAAKTARSHRMVSVSASLMAELRPLLDRPRGEPLLVVGGGAVRYRAAQYAWRAAVERARAGYPVTGEPTLKDLRSSHCSWLLADGVNPKVVQERLGHEKIATTMEIYARVSRDADSAAAALLEDLGTTNAPTGP